MALTVETGAVVAGADSYISLADANTYFTNHGSPSEWADATDAEKEAALRYAVQWIDSAFSWKGEVKDDDQVLDWPRAGVYDDERRLVASTSIPQRVKDAQCEAALEHLKSSLIAGLDRGGRVKRRRVEGAVEIEFADYAPGERARYHVERLLAPFLAASSYGLRLVRA